jgi:hypothetical protein
MEILKHLDSVEQIMPWPFPSLFVDFSLVTHWNLQEFDKY